jgi:CPA2 family monovalent cation:H+ antiporter-2
MGHLPKLIEDLALILMAGAAVTLIFRKIKQPLVLGYIIAGFLVGPHFKLTPSVADAENVETLAEIGVIFLLFSLGLEFSFKKLMRVGGSASITAMVEIVFITFAGYGLGRVLGWSSMDSLFLGGMLASSSTTIIIRAFEELGLKSKKFAGIVFGVLVVEDIVVILLMVLLSTIAVTQQFEGSQILFTISKLLFFLALWFIMGIYLLPTFLKSVRKYLDEEAILVLAVGLCLGMVVLATQSGFSAELGAFIMGSIIAETTYAEKVEHVTKPVKDLFGSVFFVSVGMMIDPASIIEHKWTVIAVTLLTLFGKLFSTTIGALLSGQPLKQSIQVGMSMAQIGEFAFIVATLGLSLGVISDFLFPVAVGASAITTFTTPYLIKLSEPVYNKLVRIIPPKWLSRINRYSSGTQNIKAESTWKAVFKSYARICTVNGIIILAIMLISLRFLYPFLEMTIENTALTNIVTIVLSLGVASPFLWAFMTRKPDNMAYRELWLDDKYNHGPLVALEISRILLGLFIIGFWMEQFLPLQVVVFIVVPSVVAVFYFFSKRIQKFYRRLEGRFITNLNERELVRRGSETMNANVMSMNDNKVELIPWDAHMVDLTVPPNATYLGKPLEELAWREKFGINLVYIKRGDALIAAPKRNEVLMPFDEVGVIATDEQVNLFVKAFESKTIPASENTNIDDIALQKLVVNEQNRLKGHTIRSSGIREFTNGLVVGIERGNSRVLNPDTSSVFEWGDVVWIVGDWRKIQQFKAIKLPD